ncbi:MAG: hypothetical protein H6Q12_477 [Bacteroidetes bacterium]|nr:hypothetical protein [Bacteroidota bacterium]
MVKKCFLCISLFLVAQLSLGQNIEKLFKEFSDAPNVENVKLDKSMMNLAKSFSKGDDLGGVKDIDSLQVLDLSKCSSEIKDKFAEKVKTLNTEGYETLVRSNENGENVRVLVKMNNEDISELVVVTTGKEAALVKIKGKFNKSDISKLTNKQ